MPSGAMLVNGFLRPAEKPLAIDIARGYLDLAPASGLRAVYRRFRFPVC